MFLVSRQEFSIKSLIPCGDENVLLALDCVKELELKITSIAIVCKYWKLLTLRITFFPEIPRISIFQVDIFRYKSTHIPCWKSSTYLICNIFVCSIFLYLCYGFNHDITNVFRSSLLFFILLILNQNTTMEAFLKITLFYL